MDYTFWRLKIRLITEGGREIEKNPLEIIQRILYGNGVFIQLFFVSLPMPK